MQAYVAEPSLLALSDSTYLLFFTAFADWEGSPPVIGMAYGPSPFGPWEVLDEPIVSTNAAWNEVWVGAPDALLEANKIKLYYTGIDTRGVAHIGLVTALLPK
jgi:hypothetical protein